MPYTGTCQRCQSLNFCMQSYMGKLTTVKQLAALVLTGDLAQVDIKVPFQKHSQERPYSLVSRNQLPPQSGIVLAFENPPDVYSIRSVSLISSM
jgi:hypothetical protein